MRYVPSPTVLSMVVYGASGLAFVGANLLLARVLSTEQYALLTLLVALTTLGHHLAPMGLDAVVTRGRVDVGWPLLKRVAGVATGVGVAVSIDGVPSVWAFRGDRRCCCSPERPRAGSCSSPARDFRASSGSSQSLALVMSQNLLLLLGAVRDDRSRVAHGRLVVRHSDGRARAWRPAVGWALVLRERRASSGRIRRRTVERGARARGRQRRGHAVHPARAARDPARA